MTDDAIDDTIILPTVGEILLEEFLIPLGITPYRLSKDLGVSTSSILDLVHGKRKVTVEMALRLAKYFGRAPDSGSICKMSWIYEKPKTNLLTTWQRFLTASK